jgi:hypothetical protein
MFLPPAPPILDFKHKLDEIKKRTHGASHTFPNTIRWPAISCSCTRVLPILMYSSICQSCRALQPSRQHLRIHSLSILLLRAKKQYRMELHSPQRHARFLSVGRSAATYRSWNAISASVAYRTTFTTGNRVVTGRGTVTMRYKDISRISIRESRCPS